MSEFLLKRMEKALKIGLETHTMDDVLQCLHNGEMQMFANEEGVCITEIKQTPRKKYMSVFLLAGRLPALRELYPVVVEHAKEQGCDFILGGGRMGWEKAVYPDWSKQFVTYKLDLKKGTDHAR
jgi:hypothetical protein